MSFEIDGYVMDPDGRPLQSTRLRLWGSALEDFVHHLLSCLRAQKEAGATPTISLVKRETLEGEGMEVSFVYNEPQVSLGQYRTVNSIIARELPLGRPLFSATLSSRGRQGAVNRTGLFVRGLLIQWAAVKERPH